MAVGNFRKLVVPFLMGQRRDGLCRVRELDRDAWEIVDAPDLVDRAVEDPNEQLRRMGRIYAHLSEKVGAIAGAGAVPVTVAGDCVSSLGVLAGLDRAGARPGRILWIDAHGDFHTWATTQTKYLGGMALALLAGRGDRRQGSRDAVSPFWSTIGFDPYPEERIILCGARDLDPGEDEALRRSNMVCCGINDVASHLVPGQSLYVHWDTDVLDGEEDLPGLKYHVRRGPSRAELGGLFRSLPRERIVAVSVSAWHPEHDAGDRTASACLELLQELLGHGPIGGGR